MLSDILKSRYIITKYLHRKSQSRQYRVHRCSNFSWLWCQDCDWLSLPTS